MPHYKLTQQLKARRIRETHSEFKLDRIRHQESQSDIRRALQSTSASEFLLAEVL